MWVVTGNSTTTALSDGIFTTAVTSSSLRSAGASGGTATAWSISLGEKKRVGGGAFCYGEEGRVPALHKMFVILQVDTVGAKIKDGFQGSGRDLLSFVRSELLFAPKTDPETTVRTSCVVIDFGARLIRKMNARPELNANFRRDAAHSASMCGKRGKKERFEIIFSQSQGGIPRNTSRRYGGVNVVVPDAAQRRGNEFEW